MTENNLKFHYQLVRAGGDEVDQLTVHEAFSTVKGHLYMVSPVPIQMIGDTKEELHELLTTLDKDIESYGIVQYEDIQNEIDRWSENNYGYGDSETSEAFSDFMNEEEALIDSDFYDHEDKVLDLVDFMKKRR